MTVSSGPGLRGASDTSARTPSEIRRCLVAPGAPRPSKNKPFEMMTSDMTRSGDSTRSPRLRGQGQVHRLPEKELFWREYERVLHNDKSSIFGRGEPPSQFGSTRIVGESQCTTSRLVLQIHLKIHSIGGDRFERSGHFAAARPRYANRTSILHAGRSHPLLRRCWGANRPCRRSGPAGRHDGVGALASLRSHPRRGTRTHRGQRTTTRDDWVGL